jgi:hypothetical protein
MIFSRLDTHAYFSAFGRVRQTASHAAPKRTPLEAAVSRGAQGCAKPTLQSAPALLHTSLQWIEAPSLVSCSRATLAHVQSVTNLQPPSL